MSLFDLFNTKPRTDDEIREIAKQEFAELFGEGTGWNSEELEKVIAKHAMKPAQVRELADGVLGDLFDGLRIIDVTRVDPALKGGKKPLDPVLKQYTAESTIFILPEGEYRIDSSVELRDFDRLALVGHPRATIKVEEDLKYGLILGGKSGQKAEDCPESVIVSNITLDISKEGIGPVCLRTRVSDYMEWNNVTIKGRVDRMHKLGTVLPSIRSPTGKGVIRNLRMIDGSRFDPDELREKSGKDMDDSTAQIDATIGLNMPNDHVGTLRIEDSHIAGFPNNGMYLSRTNHAGKVIVEGGSIKDCGNSLLRLGNNDVARDVELVIDDDSFTSCALNYNYGAPRAENITIKAPKATHDVVRFSGTGGTLSNSTIECGGSQHVIEINGSEEHPVRIQSVDLVDTADGYTKNQVIQINRNGVSLNDVNVRVEHTGRYARNAIQVNGDWCNLTDVSVYKPGSGNSVEIAGRGTKMTGCRMGGGDLTVSSGGKRDLLIKDSFTAGLKGITQEEIDPEPKVVKQQVPTTTSGPDHILCEGTKWETEAYVIDSGRDGPTAFVVGGQHGDEPVGWHSAQRLLQAKLGNGKLVVVPRANVVAIETGEHSPNGGNLNRSWNADGDCTHPVSKAIWALIKEYKPDVVIDSHSSGKTHADGLHGQMFYPTKEGRAVAHDVADFINEYYLAGSGHPGKYKFGIGNNQNDSTSTLLTHRVGVQLEIPGYIVETARSGTTLDERTEWQYAAICELLRRNGLRLD